jgi:hypothetical protein
MVNAFVNAGDKIIMATKKEKKVRKTSSLAVADTREGEAPPLGTVAIAVQLQVHLTNASAFDEVVIEMGCLGLVEEPDEVQALNTTGLDPARPITTDAEGVHLFFSPPLTAGKHGFNLQCLYTDAVIGRTYVAPAPPSEVVP